MNDAWSEIDITATDYSDLIDAACIANQIKRPGTYSEEELMRRVGPQPTQQPELGQAFICAAQVQRDAEAARVAEAQAAEATKAAETERLRLEEQARGTEVDLEVGSANPKGQQNLVATQEDARIASEERHVPESVASAEQTGEASTAPASGEPMKDTPVSGPVQEGHSSV